MALVNGSIADNTLNQFFSTYLEEALRPRVPWAGVFDNRFEGAFRSNRRVMLPQFDSQTSSDGSTWADGFTLDTSFDDRYGSIDGHNRPDMSWVEWKLAQKVAYKFNVSTRDEEQTAIGLATQMLDTAAVKVADRLNTFWRTTGKATSNFSLTGHTIDSANLTDASNAALAANVAVGITKENGQAIINALVQAQSVLESAGMWSTGETPVRPFAMLPAGIHAMLQLAIIDSGNRLDPIVSSVATAGQVPNLFGWVFYSDPGDALLTSGTTRGQITIGLTGGMSGILAARRDIAQGYWPRW